MTTNHIYVTSTLLIALSLSTAQAGVKKIDSSEARETLQDVEQSAALAQEQADGLLAITGNTTVSFETHQIRLTALKDALNKAGEEINRLETESPAPWEREAIAKASPLLADAAANTQKAIDYYRDNRLRLWAPDYHAFADRISQDSTEATKILKDYLSYSRARDREARLEQRIVTSGE